MPPVLPPILAPAPRLAVRTGFPFRTSLERHDSAPLHPGEVLREEYMPHWHLDAAALARRTGIEPARLDDLLAEKCAVTPDVAARLADAFAVSQRFWLALQMQYDLWHAVSEARAT